jgi:hypothetical protein
VALAGLVPAIVVVALTGFTAPVAQARQAARPAPRDVAATHALLLAFDAFAEAQLATLTQATAAVEGNAARISGECPGVLASPSPAEEKLQSISAGSQAPPSPRESGEILRTSSQRRELGLELSIALSSAALQPDRAATEALLTAAARLRWSSRTVTLLVRLMSADLYEELDVPSLAVCADMQWWVSSGYRTLSPGTKELFNRSTTIFGEHIHAVAFVFTVTAPPFPLLAPYENAPDRTLARHAESLAAQLRAASETRAKVSGRVAGALGLPVAAPNITVSPSAKEPAMAKQLSIPSPTGTRLTSGSVPRGPTFTIRAERHRELGHSYFRLNLETKDDESIFGPGNAAAFENTLEEAGGRLFERPQSFSECTPQPYAIIYGLLAAPRDTVLARVLGHLIPLEKVAIPARLHVGGILAYGVFSPLPTELVVRNARGVVVSRASGLGQAAKAATETCEGEAEG